MPYTPFVERIIIPAGSVRSEPLRIHFAPTEPGAKTLLIVIAEPGSRATIIEELAGTVEWSHSVEVQVGEGAAVEFVSLNAVPSTVQLTVSQRGGVQAGGSITWRNASIGSGMLTHNLRSEVSGADGESQVEWLFFAHGQERQHLSVRNLFSAPRGRGEIIMKGVAEDKAHVSVRGTIDIGLAGGGTNTYLTQNVLMLDRTAKVDAVPGLEIKTNDVKASHSATVSRVTDEDLFYFASRGIENAEARHMFILGFLQDLAARIIDPAIRQRILSGIERKYGIHSIV